MTSTRKMKLRRKFTVWTLMGITGALILYLLLSKERGILTLSAIIIIIINIGIIYLIENLPYGTGSNSRKFFIIKSETLVNIMCLLTAAGVIELIIFLLLNEPRPMLLLLLFTIAAAFTVPALKVPHIKEVES